MYICENWRDYYRISVWISTVYLPPSTPHPPTMGKHIFLSISQHINQNYSIMSSYRVVVIAVSFLFQEVPALGDQDGTREHAGHQGRPKDGDDHIARTTITSSSIRRSHRPYDDQIVRTTITSSIRRSGPRHTQQHPFSYKIFISLPLFSNLSVTSTPVFLLLFLE
jgi:hypothetical protein